MASILTPLSEKGVLMFLSELRFRAIVLMECLNGIDRASGIFGMRNAFVIMKSCNANNTGLYSSVAERQSCKLKVLGSIPSGGLFDSLAGA